MAQPRRAYPIIIITILSLFGCLALLWATPLGINVTPDSVAYIGAARSLLADNGLSMPSVSSEARPLTHYPPLYPLLLATGSLAGSDPLDGARWLNALLFGANILLIGSIVYRWLPAWGWLSVIGAFLMLTSTTLLQIHAAAWTEPLFLLFGFAGLALLGMYLETYRAPLLVCSSVAVGLAVITRYAGLPFVLAGGLGLLLLSDRRRRSRGVDALLFCGLALVPLLLWVIRNLRLGASATNRSLDYHPVRLQHIKAALNTLSLWHMPASVPSAFRVGVSIALGICIFGTYLYLYWLRDGPANRPATIERRANIMALLALFSILYVLFLIATVSFVDALLPFDQRILSPLYLVWLVFVLYVLGESAAHVSRPFQYIFIVLLGVGCLSLTFQAIGWALDNRRNGAGYTTAAWQRSELIAQLRRLPAGTPIFSNGEDAVYILTGRPASSVPHVADALSDRTNHTYEHEMARMEQMLRADGAVIVYFRRLAKRTWNVSEEELQAAIPLQEVYTGTDGTIYATVR